MPTLSCVVTYSIKSYKKYSVVNDFEASNTVVVRRLRCAARILGLPTLLAVKLLLLLNYTHAKYVCEKDFEASKLESSSDLRVALLNSCIPSSSLALYDFLQNYGQVKQLFKWQSDKF